MAALEKTPLLSVAIICRNAADLLPATLQSVVSIADEIVVLDTGSTDRTVSISREAGATVIEESWQDSFSEARNAAWEHVRGRWVLWLDAGETLSTESATQLRAFVETKANQRSAYMLLVVVPAAPGQIAGEQAGRVRLVPNLRDLRFSGRVNESLLPVILQAGIEIDALPWQITRSSYEHAPEVKLTKARRNLKLAAMQLQESGESSELLVVIGEAFSALGDPSQAAASFRRAIALSGEPSSAMREAYYGLLTCLDADPSGRDEQINVCLISLQVFPTDAQLLCAMGGYLQLQGQLDMAARAYESAFRYGQVDPWTWHVTGIDEIAASCLSLIRQLQNRDDEARTVLEQSLIRVPHSVRLRRQLIDLHIKHDRRQDALAQVEFLSMEVPNGEALRSAIRGACLAAKQNWPAALGYLRTAYNAGCRDVLCLRWLSVTYISLSDLSAAAPVLCEWQRVEPINAELQQYLTLLQPTAGVEVIEVSDAAESYEGRRLRVDAPSLADVAAPGKPNFAATQHSLSDAHSPHR